ncbi:50S ribosomal protein L11 [Candidatus Micrarchaeota archaeon CG10_big_fil_rev_8_21_14_0_10_59_7]|nr:MAG: 50S ribosomal protein L11 [Candidatus Micrarchaeota archaeon CG10_big_fil_rev_8_21_14_0_10_59_7]
MAKMTIPAMVEGGKASAGVPLGPALGPTGVNIGNVIAAINEKTKDFAGMTVPVKVIVDKATRTFEISVGTPPVSGLIKKELGINAPVKEEAGVKGKKTIGNLTAEQCVKIARMKQDAMLAADLKAAVKEVAGTCLSLGATVDGKNPREFIADVAAGKYDAKIK